MGLGLSRAFTPLTLLTHLPYRSARRSPGLATTPASRLASTRREESNVCLRRYDLRPRGQQPSLLIALRSDPLACARHLKNQRDQFSLVPPIPFVPSSRSIDFIYKGLDSSSRYCNEIFATFRRGGGRCPLWGRFALSSARPSPAGRGEKNSFSPPTRPLETPTSPPVFSKQWAANALAARKIISSNRCDESRGANEPSPSIPR